MASRRYAENTKVEVASSIEDLQRLASRYECEDFTYAVGPKGGSCMFRIQGVPIRYDVSFPIDGDLTINQSEQEWRRRWRVVLLQAKGQFEMIEAGEMTPQRAFLSNLMLDDGRTVGDIVDTHGVAAFEGEMLPQLTMGSR